MTQKRVLHTKREYGAEREAAAVIGWLNEVDPTHPSCQRVVKIHNLLLKMELLTLLAQRHTSRTEDEEAKLTRESFRIGTQLNRVLNKYRMTPTVEPRIFAGGGVYTNWRAARTRGFIALIREYPAPAHEVDEPEVIQRLLALSRTRYLANVKQCDHCRRWFYAIRVDQRFCALNNCRQSHYHASPSFREHRKLYMRKLRKEATDRDQRAKDRLRNSKS